MYDSIRSLFIAIRIKTLSASICPVLIGSSLALKYDSFNFNIFFFTISAALLIQIGTNFFNDVYDFLKGADNKDRLGPQRAVQSNLIAPKTMIVYGAISFLIAIFCGLPLVIAGGWPILIIGLLSIVSGYLYTAGPYPLGYNGWGDIFVFIFFGPVAVCGTYYLQSFNISSIPILYGICLGALSTCLLCVNNIRDVKNDKLAGKRTIAVRVSPHFVRCIFSLLLILVNILNIYIYTKLPASYYIYSLVIIFLILSLKLSLNIFNKDGEELNDTLKQVSLLIIFFTIITLLNNVL